MGGIDGVGKGSARPPRFVHMTYTPVGEAKGHIALVGKGVTFDSGGLSLKPSEGMMTMRCDMAGAAAVIGAMKAIAGLAPQVRVDVIFGAVENMPSGTSYKLGDILKMYNGKQVEIHNTDAEGRLVLADCLSYATELKPDALVDLATLTGAAVVALGDWYSALYTRSDALAGTLAARATDAGEGIWRMPLPDLYKDKIKAEWGDIKNVGGRAGGSITAALFLSEFTTVEKWAHIDIAGPAFLDASLMHYAAGGTGTMVRTLARWIESIGDDSQS
jgi:leucyl aminopeptidase